MTVIDNCFALLFVCCLATASAAAAEHACPPSSEKFGGCNKHGLQSVTVTYYSWSPTLKKCQRRLKMDERPCGTHVEAKHGCPEPRIVEPGPCNSDTKREKTLIEHYEPDGRGGCKLLRHFAYPKCPKVPRPDTGCPEPRFFQKACADRLRQVFKFYFQLKAGECVERVNVRLEPCGAMARSHRCPPNKLLEAGRCHKGFRTLIQLEYSRDKSGRCQSRRHYVTQPCSTDASKSCPPTTSSRGPCRKGLQSVTRLYYLRDSARSRCVRKFSISTVACGTRKSLKCPKPRILEPGVCLASRVKVLVAHFEPDEKTGKCREMKIYVTHRCKGEVGKVDKKEDLRCPDKTYSQGSCKEGYRNLFTFVYKFNDVLDRCVKNVILKREKCAALVTSSSCPADEVLERGPCRRGFRSSVVYRHRRNAKGRCVRQVEKILVECDMGDKTEDCKPNSISKLSDCKDRLQRWLKIYYKYSRLKGRCVKKFEITERSCDLAKNGGAAETKKNCPRPRVIEPGPCKNGKRRLLIEHYEFNAKKKSCTVFKNFVVRRCEGKAKREKKKGEKSPKTCPEPKVSQSRCSKGYRQVTTVYFVFESAKGRCVKKIKREDEKCARLVKRTDCPPDSTVESGPCESGFRANVVFSYSRNSEGRCTKSKRTVTVTCETGAPVCPPRSRSRVSVCKSGIERWLTVYFVYSRLKKRCVRRLMYKELACKMRPTKCPTPRVVEPGPCRSGSRRILIEHFEYNAEKAKCVAMKDFVEKPCNKAEAKAKAGAKAGAKATAKARHECQDPVFHQQPCRKKYRSVMKVYFEWSGVKGRCVKRIKMEEEPCAALLAKGCPPDETIESGPCKAGYRQNIVFSHRRDEKGVCKRVELRITQACGVGSSSSHKCKPRTRQQVSACSKDGFERWLTVYYVYSSVKKRCVRKLRVKELSCKRKVCPTPRVVEPGACESGSRLVLIEHFEYDAKLKKCQKRKDFVHKLCGSPSKRKLEAEKHGCPESVYHQQVCKSDGYRTVIKFYYRYNKFKGRCVKNVKTDEEKCSKLTAVKTDCREDEVVETGPCSGGYRQNILFKYVRNSEGSCERQEHRVTEKCNAA